MQLKEKELTEIETMLLLEGIYLHYGYDFRDYSPASLSRRIKNFCDSRGISTISSLQNKVLHQPVFFKELLSAITINVTSMFRNPSFFLFLRQKVVPVLRTYPFVKIWCAGCATGQEAISLAILLSEEKLYENCRIYATDLNEEVLGQAQKSIFPISLLREYTANYLEAGGIKSFSNYYTAAYENVIFDPALKKNIIFAMHNLVQDYVFNSFNLVLCRNVLIYFNKPLQERVHDLFYQSLLPSGILGLGEQETIKFSPHEKKYVQMGNEKIYRKVT